MTLLAQLLSQRILDDGPMPFSSFMAAALYHPQLGYYTSQKLRTGRLGDFFTSVSVGPVFGELMAAEFCVAWEKLGKPDPFSIIEAGANDGQFALDVLTWAQTHRPDFLAALDYQIDEPLAAAEVLQREKLEPFADRITHNQAATVACGCYFANELLDAIPFRRVRFHQDRWWELRVGLDNDFQFSWQDHEPEDGALQRRLTWLGQDFPEGYTTEIAPAIASHLRLAADRLKQGYLFFADYGYPASDYYAPFRSTGTLRCYRAHHAHEDPFDAVGETDLTAHVDFSLAAAAAAQSGCEVLGFLDQSRFLTAAATPVLRKMEEQGEPPGTAWLRQFQTLTHPAHLGQKFHFLVLGKNVSQLDPLPSLAFARSSSVAELLKPDFQPADSPD